MNVCEERVPQLRAVHVKVSERRGSRVSGRAWEVVVTCEAVDDEDVGVDGVGDEGLLCGIESDADELAPAVLELPELRADEENPANSRRCLPEVTRLE